MKEHNNKDNVVGVISGTLLDMEELMFKGDDGVYHSADIFINSEEVTEFINDIATNLINVKDIEDKELLKDINYAGKLLSKMEFQRE